jgi:hypothetical protein
LMYGHYDMPYLPRARDVTPCPCVFWYQSTDQVTGSAGNGYTNLPGQVWVVYAGLDNPIVAKVTPGQAVSWNLTRPGVQQGDQFLFFVYVATADDAIGKQFATKVGKHLIGKDVIDQYNKAAQTPYKNLTATQSISQNSVAKPDEQMQLNATEQVAAMQGSLGVHAGAIDDPDLKVTGYLLGADIFTPKGVGFGRFYYSLAPSIFSVDGITSLVGSYLASAPDSATLSALVTTWVQQYMKDPVAAEATVTGYIQQNGNKNVVDSSQKLTAFGKSCVQALVKGPVSIKYPSLKLSTVTNYYAFDFGKAAPANMPKNPVAITPTAVL